MSEAPTASPAAAAVRQVSLADALTLASSMHREGALKAAETLYRRILAAKPDFADALHFLGLLVHQTGRSAEAVDLIRSAILREPEQAGMHNNLGNVLAQQGRPREAARAYRAALALDPANADAYSNLGACLRSLGHRRGAERSYRRAIAIDPAHEEAYTNLGRLLADLGRIDEALRCYGRAMEIAPHQKDSRRFVVATYAAAGDLDRATAVARVWAREEPESATARHLLAAVSGEGVPARASDAFVELAFDRFAASFDSKLGKLDYRVPDLAAAAVRAACGDPRGTLDILDAGCGTGLCGPLLAPFAATLSGVDLSAGMLERARARNCYTALHKRELTAMMLDHPGAFDLIVAADTFCYFGVLDAVLAAAAGALRPGGTLVFSLEAETRPVDFRLNPHGRYSHRRTPVAAALASAGFVEIAIDEAILRQERHAPVAGLLVTARRGR